MSVATHLRTGAYAPPHAFAFDESPRPQGYPLVGLLPKVRQDPLKFFVETALEFGDAVKLDLGLNEVLMLNHPDYIRHVAQDNYRNYHKSRFYGPLKPILGEGIFLAEGDFWVSQRQTAGRAFHGPELKRMIDDMAGATRDLIARWRGLLKIGAPVDVCAEMSRLTLDIVLRCLFNVRLGDQQRRVYDALTYLLRDAERRVWSFASLPKWLPTPGNMECARALKALDDFVAEIIEARKSSGEKKNDLLQILIDSYDGRPASEVPPSLLRDQVLSMILAGHETSANALAWTWYLLSMHPDSARTAKAEADDVLGGRDPVFDDIANLRTAKAVFQETLRLFPPVWTISRTAQADDRIGPMAVKAGTNVMLCAFAVHRRPEYWSNPEGFDPSRFDERNGPIRRYSYFPFGVGARSCLGERFGTMESIIIIAMLLREFKMALVPGQHVRAEPMITLRPGGSIYMSLADA